MKKKEELTSEFIMDYWLQKYHGITTQWLIDNESELIKTPKWYKKYSVTQLEHDEWYEWAIDTISKHRRLPKRYVRKSFVWDYLNLAPNIKE